MEVRRLALDFWVPGQPKIKTEPGVEKKDVAMKGFKGKENEKDGSDSVGTLGTFACLSVY